MRQMRKTVATVAAVLVISGCYKATIQTGIQPGPVEISRSQATWINGLVPASPVNAVEDCGDAGVAIIQTEHSFLNQLLGALTLGIYTPVTVRIRCGSASGEDGDDRGEEDAADGKGGIASASGLRVTTGPNPTYAELRELLSDMRNTGCGSATFAWTETRRLDAHCVD